MLSAGGISFGMSYPQTLWFLAFFFLIPVLYYLDTYEQDSFAKSFGYMFFFSFTFIVFSTRWFLSTYPLDWLKISNAPLSLVMIGGIWLLFSLGVSLPLAFWLPCISRIRNLSFLTNALIGGFFWVIFEYLRSWFVALSIYGNETLFGPHHTYYSLAYLLSGVPFLKNILPVGGIYLGTFVIILINYFLYYLFFSKVKQKKQTVFLFVLVFVIILFCSSYMNLLRREDSEGVYFSATVVTTRLAPSLSLEKEKGEIVVNLTNSLKNTKSIIILPENANILIPSFTNVEQMESLKNKNLIIGSFSGAHFYNMYFFNPSTKYTEYYKKQLLMPVGEYNVAFLNFLIKLASNKEWSVLYDRIKRFSKKGSGSSVFKEESVKGLIFGSSLCSENISPYIYRNATRAGATVLLNLASHRPFHDSSLLSRQTLAINTVRALENGRYFVTASNYDQSFVITDTGNLSYISKSESIFLVDSVNIQIKKYITPYTAYGDYFVYISFIYISLYLVWSFKERK